MNIEATALIEKIIREECRDNQGFDMLKSENRDNIVSFSKDSYHLFLKLSHMSIQFSIQIEENSVCCLIFPDPVIVSEDTRDDFIRFINHVNWLTLGLGHFYVDTNYDIAYALRIPEYYVLQQSEDFKKELLCTPVNFYTDMEKPLVHLSNREWDSTVAIKYIDELYTNGYVNNDNYGI